MPTKWEKLFGKKGKRPPPTTGIVSPRKGMTKIMMEGSRTLDDNDDDGSDLVGHDFTQNLNNTHHLHFLKLEPNICPYATYTLTKLPGIQKETNSILHKIDTYIGSTEISSLEDKLII
jgi:hypothetical protein